MTNSPDEGARECAAQTVTTTQYVVPDGPAPPKGDGYRHVCNCGRERIAALEKELETRFAENLIALGVREGEGK